MRIQKFAVLVGIIFFTACAVSAQESKVELSAKEKILVFPFDSAHLKDAGMGKAVADAIITELINMKRFEVADRVHIEKIMKEQALGLSGMMDEKNAVEVGNLLGANKAIMGSVSSFSVSANKKGGCDGSMRVSIKIVNVETSIIERAKTLSVTASVGPSVDRLKKGCKAKIRDMLINAVSKKFFNTMRDYFKLKTYIMTVNGSKVTMRMGRDMGIKPNFRFDAVNQGAEIKDPLTGEVLEVKQNKLAHIWITKVDEKLSYGKVFLNKGVLTPGTQLVEYPTTNIFTSVNSGVYPFVQSAFNISTIYDDGTDQYDIDYNFRNVTSAFTLGIESGKRFFWGNASVDADLILSSPIYGLKMTVGGLVDMFRLGPLEVSLGARLGGYGAMSSVGSVGLGNISGADFLLAPDGTHVPAGTGLSAFNLSAGGEGLGRISLNLSRNFSLNITAGFAYFFASPWSLYASWTDNADESQSVFLDTDNLGARPDPLKLQGIIIKGCISWSF